MAKRKIPQHLRYQWDKWFDGRLHVLVRGQDYFIRNVSFQAGVAKAAARRGGRCITYKVHHGLLVQFIPFSVLNQLSVESMKEAFYDWQARAWQSGKDDSRDS